MSETYITHDPESSDRVSFVPIAQRANNKEQQKRTNNWFIHFPCSTDVLAMQKNGTLIKKIRLNVDAIQSSRFKVSSNGIDNLYFANKLRITFPHINLDVFRYGLVVFWKFVDRTLSPGWNAIASSHLFPELLCDITQRSNDVAAKLRNLTISWIQSDSLSRNAVTNGGYRKTTKCRTIQARKFSNFT